jgi:hypothetical protein
VNGYLRVGGYAPYGGPEGREKVLDDLEDWVKEQSHKHSGNADVVRRELEKFHGLRVSLRSVDRAVSVWSMPSGHVYS